MIKKESFKLVTVVLLLFCCTYVQSIKFFIQIPGMERPCFYEVLSQSQKYSIQLAPSNQVKYQLQISQSEEGTWKNVYYRMTNIGYERIEVHKLALSSTTYAFCIKNIQNDLLRISIKFKTGVQLMQFQLLPDKSDTQNLDRQISWIESQKKSLYDTIRHIEQKKTNNINASSLLSTKMILFAILGLFSIVVVNFLFFKEVKKTFKQRKLV